MTVKVPTASDAITVRQYIDYYAAVDDIERVRIATGKSTEVIKLMTVETVRTIIDTFENAVRIGSATEFRKAGKLGLIPDFTAMSFGEWIDLEQLSNNIQTDGKLNGDILIKFLSVLYRPITVSMDKFYRIADYDCDTTYQYEDEILKINMSVVNAVRLFFSSLEKELSESSLKYLEAERMKIMKMTTS